MGLPKIRINLATFSVKTSNDVVKTKLEEVLGGIFFFSCSVNICGSGSFLCGESGFVRSSIYWPDRTRILLLVFIDNCHQKVIIRGAGKFVFV